MSEQKDITQLSEDQTDEALGSAEHARIADAVRQLPRFEPVGSMAPVIVARIRRKAQMRFATGFSAAAAACLTLVAVLHSQPSGSPDRAVSETASLYDWHNEAVATSVLPGDGANMTAFSQIAENIESH
jgi:hypothetical protein